jgi:hypothetical protein
MISICFLQRESHLFTNRRASVFCFLKGLLSFYQCFLMFMYVCALLVVIVAVLQYSTLYIVCRALVQLIV